MTQLAVKSKVKNTHNSTIRFKLARLAGLYLAGTQLAARIELHCARCTSTGAGSGPNELGFSHWPRLAWPTATLARARASFNLNPVRSSLKSVVSVEAVCTGPLADSPALYGLAGWLASCAAGPADMRIIEAPTEAGGSGNDPALRSARLLLEHQMVRTDIFHKF